MNPQWLYLVPVAMIIAGLIAEHLANIRHRQGLAVAAALIQTHSDEYLRNMNQITDAAAATTITMDDLLQALNTYGLAAVEDAR